MQVNFEVFKQGLR